MNKQEIDNLTLILKEGYSHICVNPGDLNIFLNVPIQKKNFYPCINRAARLIGKRGFFNGGKTTMWVDWTINMGHLKIAIQPPYELTTKDDPYSENANPKLYMGPANITKGWSDPMSYRELDSVVKIQKMMKLRAFW